MAAFKGLAKAALALVPEDDLQFFEDAVEWVSNPDHGLDSLSIGGTDGSSTLDGGCSSSPRWSSFVRRTTC